MAKNSPKPGSGKYYVARNRPPLDKYQIGDEVPEAFDWPRAASMLKLGMLQFIPSMPPSPPKAPEPKKDPLQTIEEKPGPDAEAIKTDAPSPALAEASRLGADLLAKPEAPKHGSRAKNAPK